MLRFLPAANADERHVREVTARFVDEFVRPTTEADDAASRFRRDLFSKVTKLGFHAYTHEKRYGGGGGSYVPYYSFLEELGRGSLSLSVSTGVTNLVQGALSQFGTDAQKQSYLRPLVQGDLLGAFSLSEPQAGSDASALRLAATQAPKGYVLNGTKCWCSNAGHADLYLVIARTGEHRTKGISAFVVPASTPGLRIGKQEKKLGLRASTLAELVFEDCFIPEAQRLGDEGMGLTIALTQLDAGRVSIAASGIAATTETIEKIWPLIQDDESFNRQGIRQRFAGYVSELMGVKALIRETAIRRDEGTPLTVLAASAKLLASDLALKVCDDAVAVLGYEGVRSGSGFERLLRDAKALQIVEGTNQIQRMVLERQITEMYLP